jgi:hypothetical protein
VILAASVLALAAGTSACTASSGPATVDKTEVAREISTKLKAQVGKAPDVVSCPENLEATEGATLICTLTEQGVSYDVTATVTSAVEGDVKFDIKVANTPNP